MYGSDESCRNIKQLVENIILGVYIDLLEQRKIIVIITHTGLVNSPGIGF